MSTLLNVTTAAVPFAPKHSMSAITEDFVQKKLQKAFRLGTNTDGYSEIDLRPENPLRCAAVLIPLVSFKDEWHVLYTRRTERVESHKGQVAFPGGACDDGETSPEQTALREADEEIGIHPKDVHVLGQMESMITISYFRVTPVVGVIQFPYAFKTSGAEVARVFTIPLLWLAEKTNYWEFPLPDSERTLIAYHPYDGELLWGATARMTLNFLKILGLIQ